MTITNFSELKSLLLKSLSDNNVKDDAIINLNDNYVFTWIDLIDFLDKQTDLSCFFTLEIKKIINSNENIFNFLNPIAIQFLQSIKK